MKVLTLMLASSLMFVPAAGASAIGHWSEDPQGLPAFDLEARLPISTHAADGTPFPLRSDPIFLLGNYRLTLFVHGSGILQIVTGERTWARLNAAGSSYGANRSVLRVTTFEGERSYSLVGLDSLAADPAICRRSFGTGFAEFEYALGGGLSVVRTISIAPSQRINEGLPGFVVSVTLRNKGTQAATFSYEEAVLANYEAMADRLQQPAERLVHYSHRPSVDQKNLSVRCDITAESEDPTVLRSRTEASRFDAFPPSLVLAALTSPNATGSAEMFTEPSAAGGHFLGERFASKLAPGESRTLHWLVCLVPQGDDGVVAALRQVVDVAQTAPFFRDDWKRRLPNFTVLTTSA